MIIESEARAMVKCPHCGSTAQPKQRGTVTVSDNGRYFCEVYQCGCGCTFEALFPRVEVEEYVVWHLEDLSDK
jgi:hypothetical protein